MKKQCENFGPLLSAYLVGELHHKEHRMVREHLKTCNECRQLAHDLEETGDMVKSVLSSEPLPDVDFDGIWGEIETQVLFGPPFRQKIIKGIVRPAVWLPASLVTAAVAILVFMVPVVREQAPTKLSRVESVYSSTGQVMVLQTATSSQPLIWILPEAGKGAGS